MQTRHPITELNDLDAGEFVRVLGPVFEHSPWIAEITWRQRPFGGFDSLHHALCDAVRGAPAEKKLSLIRAHPDLVGKMTLTAASASEQAAAGLTSLTPGEVALFQKQNAAYHEKFGFPFIICARLNKKEAILEGFARRLQNPPEQEINTALEEIYKIAGLRLRDLLTE